MEAIKLLAGIGSPLKGKLMFCDFRDMCFTTIDIFKRPDCPVCGEKRPIKAAEEVRLAMLCGHNTVNVNPPKPIKESLEPTPRTVGRALQNTLKVLPFGGVSIRRRHRGQPLRRRTHVN